tara:strand:- start:453 stop:1169 length:717 start_codon:yes stop_codon:yes gene_type:complete
MSLIDDIKTDQKTQIMVAGMLFFALAFPGYFYYLSGQELDEYSISGPVGDYSVEGTYSYHVIADGSTYVNDGTTADIMANSDAAGAEIDGKNIVGVRATLSFIDDETQQGVGCASPTANDPVDDDVSGNMMHSMLEQANATQSGDSVILEWHDSSIVGTTVSNMSESEVRMMLDGEFGIGEHSLGISVNVNTGGGPGCQSNDDGEEVAYVIELISLEYTLEMVEADEEAEEEEEEAEE